MSIIWRCFTAVFYLTLNKVVLCSMCVDVIDGGAWMQCSASVTQFIEDLDKTARHLHVTGSQHPVTRRTSWRHWPPDVTRWPRCQSTFTRASALSKYSPLFVIDKFHNPVFSVSVCPRIYSTVIRQWSSAVAVIADRTAYDTWYSCRPLSGIALVSMSIHLFRPTVSNFAVDAGSLLLTHVHQSV